MARIYAPAHPTRPLDAALLAVLRTLPDDFWVFTGLELNRPVDLLIIRTATEAQSEPRSTLICTTVWPAPRPLYGKEDGPWSERAGTEWRPLPASPYGDLNPYRRAVEVANATRAWLYNNQRIILPGDELRPQGEFKLWPDLLLLSPSGTDHRLPLVPSSRYGQWFTDLQAWRAHLVDWKPRGELALGEEAMRSIAMLLDLEPVLAPVSVASGPAPSRQATPADPAAPPDEVPAPRQAQPTAVQAPRPADVDAVLTWLHGLEDRIQRVEETLTRLDAAVAGRGLTGEAGGAIALLGSLLAGANGQRGR